MSHLNESANQVLGGSGSHNQQGNDFNFCFDPALVVKTQSDPAHVATAPTPGSVALLASLPNETKDQVTSTGNGASASVMPSSAHGEMLGQKKTRRSKKKKFEPYPLPRAVLDDVANVSAENLATNPGCFLSRAVLTGVKNTYLPSGGTIQFLFDSERRLLRVHSGAIECTHGALEAILDYNAVGPNRMTRKLKLCPQYELLMAKAVKKKQSDTEQIAAEHKPLPVKEELVLGHDVCEAGFHCPYVHLAATKDEDGEPGVVLDQFRHNYVHWRKVRSSLQGYECFDHGLTLPLAEPNSHAAIDTDCSTILVTQGAREFLIKQQAEKAKHETPLDENDPTTQASLLNVVTEGSPRAPEDRSDDSSVDAECKAENDEGAPEKLEKELKELQHCAHYKKNGMCCLGATCKFVHALGTEEEEAELLAQQIAAEGKRSGGNTGTGGSFVRRSVGTPGSANINQLKNTPVMVGTPGSIVGRPMGPLTPNLMPPPPTATAFTQPAMIPMPVMPATSGIGFSGINIGAPNSYVHRVTPGSTPGSAGALLHPHTPVMMHGVHPMMGAHPHATPGAIPPAQIAASPPIGYPQHQVLSGASHTLNMQPIMQPIMVPGMTYAPMMQPGGAPLMMATPPPHVGIPMTSPPTLPTNRGGTPSAMPSSQAGQTVTGADGQQYMLVPVKK